MMHRFVYVSLLSAAISLSALPAFSQSFTEGHDAYEDDNYPKALDHFRPLAEQGDSKSQYFLGKMNEKGKGMPRDASAAILWLKRAAEQDNTDAMQEIGYMYYYGHGDVEQNKRLTYKWFKRAAELNNPESQYLLAFEMYTRGQGTPQNFSEAAKWYLRSAEQGYTDALLMLGEMYHEGLGVSQNPIIAYIMANLAESLYDNYTGYSRDLYLEELNSEQVTEAQRLASEWKIGTPLPTSEEVNTWP